MKKLLIPAFAVGLLAGCWDSGGSTATTAQATTAAAGSVDQFQVVSAVDAFGGATPAGAAGPYVVITGIVHGKLDPKNAANAGIVDLANAPVDAAGMVEYSTDVVILRPKSASTARRVLFYDVVNRGNKLALSSFVGGGALTTGAAPSAAFPSILRRGYTVVWSGWQGSIAQTGNGASAAVGTVFPTAANADGSAITGLSREEFIPDYAGGNATTIPLSYPPASTTDLSEVTFTARQSWLNSAGQQDYAAPSAPVTTWSYVKNANGSYSVSFTPPAAVPDATGAMVPPDAGTIYSFVYRASSPMVNGIGFAAVRDLITFLKTASADGQGNANPLNDMKAAACASGVNCPANPATNFDVALGEGISQSGRFLRD
ncbi:MAG: peptidase, partial [Burkholderiales bacterium]|nr:peptidase [Burkholderiales bacterium]